MLKYIKRWQCGPRWHISLDLKMKRSSEVIYTFLDKSKTEFQRIPNFNFTENVKRLVDYSFTDVSDSDEDCSDDGIYKVDPLEKLQSDLVVLKSKLSKTQFNRFSQLRKVKQGGNLRMRASRKLKIEEDKEKLRNEDVLQRLNTAFTEAKYAPLIESPSLFVTKLGSKGSKSACHIFDTNRPSKKRKLDMSVMKRFSRKHFNKKSRKMLLHRQSEDITQSGCLLGLFKLFQDTDYLH